MERILCGGGGDVNWNLYVMSEGGRGCRGMADLKEGIQKRNRGRERETQRSGIGKSEGDERKK